MASPDETNGKTKSTEPRKPRHVLLPNLLAQEETQEEVGLNPLRFNLLAHQPCCGTRLLTAGDVARVRLLMEGLARPRGPTLADIAQALSIAARKNSFHPVRDWLAGLHWDGEERIPQLATAILHTEKAHEATSTAVLLQWFQTAVARVQEPGAHDAGGMLVLVGEPGADADPELFFRTLVPRPFYVDAPGIGAVDELRHHLRRAWVINRSDLASLSPGASRWLVNHLQDTSDPVDGLFAAHGERAPSTSMVVGAVDEVPGIREEALRRCVWPIPFGPTIDADQLSRWRDQLWAEAAALLSKERSPRSLSPGESRHLRAVADDLLESDPWAERVLEAYRFLMYDDKRRSQNLFPSMHEIQKQMGLEVGKETVNTQHDIARVLKACGMRPRRMQVPPWSRLWWPPDALKRLAQARAQGSVVPIHVPPRDVFGAADIAKEAKRADEV